LEELDPDEIPVAMVGRVPVKISNENGPIKIGDRLTASKTKPGYAMKQTTAGQSIGVALEGLTTLTGDCELMTSDGLGTSDVNGSTCDVKKILVFVNLAYWAPANTLASAGSTILTALDGGCELTTSQVGTTCDVKEGIYNISAIASGLITWFKDSLHIVFEDGLVKIAAIITDKLTAKEVATEKLCIGATCVTEQELKALLDKNQINLISNYSN
jgi:hypothetical protein